MQYLIYSYSLLELKRQFVSEITFIVTTKYHIGRSDVRVGI